MVKWGNRLGTGTGLVGALAICGYQINQGLVADGYTIGYNTLNATSEVAGGALGGWGGAAVGASIGAWFGGFGAIPGGIIGGIVGGWGGSQAAGAAFRWLY